MKIIDLRLDHYGIYRKASWKPSQNSLNVIMGENESGKTTMLRFIRDMIFGYGRARQEVLNLSDRMDRNIKSSAMKRNAGLKIQTM